MVPKSFFIFAFSFLATVILTQIIIKLAYKKKILAIPNHRSLHKLPVPALGGIVFVTVFYIAITVSWSLYFSNSMVFLKIFLLSIPIVVCGLLDDFMDLSARIRMFIQIVMAAISYFLGFQIVLIKLPFLTLDVNYISSLLTIFFIVAMTNLFNFIDGMDGYLAGNVCIALLGLSVCFILNSQIKIAIICLILIANLLGFLMLNFPKAKIFMGDAGSCFLGFFTALMSVLCDMHYNLSLIIPLIMCSVIIFDATITLLIRLFQRKKIWEAHNEHEYQKLYFVLKSQKKVVLISYLHSFFLSLMGILYGVSDKHTRLLVLLICILSLSIKYGTVYYLHIKCLNKTS